MTDVIAVDTTEKIHYPSEISLQTRCVAVGALGICVPANGLFAAGKYSYF
jgi:hypothetical protein